MGNARLDYIWLDGYEIANIRTKAQVLSDSSYTGAIEDTPAWGFDGSSTQQAAGHDSDCILQPVRVYPNPFKTNAYFVLCEVFNRDGTPHETNTRNRIDREREGEFWFGFEQE